MFLTPEMADAFGDWLECGRIQRALIAALPELGEAITHDELRPLLKIRRQDGGSVLVARSAEGASGRWIVGIPGRPAPAIYEADSIEEVVGIVLGALGNPGTEAVRGSACGTGE